MLRIRLSSMGIKASTAARSSSETSDLALHAPLRPSPAEGPRRVEREPHTSVRVRNQEPLCAAMWQGVQLLRGTMLPSGLKVSSLK